QRAGSNSFASQAMPTENPLASKAEIGPAAERPSSRRSQLDATSPASGVTAPSPVTTTLRSPFARIGVRSLVCHRQAAFAPCLVVRGPTADAPGAVELGTGVEARRRLEAIARREMRGLDSITRRSASAIRGRVGARARGEATRDRRPASELLQPRCAPQ